MTSKKPVILISLDCEDRPSRRGPVKTLSLSSNYAEAVLEAGGLPWLFPHTEDAQCLQEAVAAADGLLLSGGDFDIDPKLFGEAPHPKLGTLVPERTATELNLLRAAESRQIPVFGVCGGMQLMNVHRGGTLFQDLDSQMEGVLEHQQPQPKDQPGHAIEIIAGSLLHTLTQQRDLGVNSTHHQAVRQTGRDLTICAKSPDGVVEAIEDPSLSFYLGVQWHPEAMLEAEQKALYSGFVAACNRQI